MYYALYGIRKVINKDEFVVIFFILYNLHAYYKSLECFIYFNYSHVIVLCLLLFMIDNK